MLTTPFRCSFGNEDATENAVSAMLKICIVPELGMPEANYMPGILSMLPFTNDMEETDFVYGHLSTQLQQHLSTCAVCSSVGVHAPNLNPPAHAGAPCR